MKKAKLIDWNVNKILSKINQPKLMSLFLRDLLTPQELEEIKRRLLIIKLLKQGLPQRVVAKKLKIAIATITRGSKVLKNKKGGFNQLLKLNK